MDKTGTGTATIVMVDTNGSLDPASSSSDYDPMTPVAIALTNPVTSVSSPIFTGHVARWGYDVYETERLGFATIECVDSMDVFANAEMVPGAYGDAPSAAAEGDIVYDLDGQVKNRIDQVLDDVGWPVGNREVFTGNVRVKGKVYAPNQPALNAITDAADAEFPSVANFYMQKNGFATFHGRLARFNPTDAQYHITTWSVGDMAAVAADSTRAVISGLDYDRDKDRIVNSGLAYPEEIDDTLIEAQRYTDATSISDFGTRSWSAENLLTDYGWLTGNTDLLETRLFAKYHVENYKRPQTRVNRITFKSVPPTNAYATRVWALLCGIDISDRIQLTTTHHGGASGFNGYHFVEGLHYRVEPMAAGYMNVTLDVDVSPAAYYTTLPSS